MEMKYFKTVAAPAFCLGLMLAAFSTIANADQWNRKTEVTFSGPVEIPGVHLTGWGILPAGAYIFKILDSQSDRHIVQIFSKDEKTVYATILAVPNQRLRATDKTVITFTERAAGEPEALRAWFYPGRTSGEEFVYPKARALALAKATNTPVLFTPTDLPVEVAEPSKLAEAPVVAELKRAPIKAVQPTGEEVEIAQVVTPPPAQEESPAVLAQAAAPPAPAPRTPAPAATVEPAPSVPAATLPETDSYLPEIAVIGLLALVSGLALRAVRKRAA
jgi:hypothetical protein